MVRMELFFPSNSSIQSLARRESLPRNDPRPVLYRTFQRIPGSASSANSISSTYTLNVTVGENQQFPLQLDTGSSDLVRLPCLPPPCQLDADPVGSLVFVHDL